MLKVLAPLRRPNPRKNLRTKVEVAEEAHPRHLLRLHPQQVLNLLLRLVGLRWKHLHQLRPVRPRLSFRLPHLRRPPLRRLNLAVQLRSIRLIIHR